MLITWLAQGPPHYVSQDGSIAYISDVGADILKPLFVTGASITAVGFFLSLVIERWLRHAGRLLPDMRQRERVLSILAILGSFIGGLGLILLSVFDTKRFPSAHQAFLLVFIVGVGLSAIFTIMEFRWISKDYVELRKLKLAYMMKGVIASILIILAIAFAITLFKAKDVGAVLEWTIAFGYTFYLLTFFYDLRMAKGVHRGDLSKGRLRDMQERGVPISAMTQGHEGDFDMYNNTRMSNDTAGGSISQPLMAQQRGNGISGTNGTGGFGSTRSNETSNVRMPNPFDTARTNAPAHYAANGRAANL